MAAYVNPIIDSECP